VGEKQKNYTVALKKHGAGGMQKNNLTAVVIQGAYEGLLNLKRTNSCSI